MIALGRVSFFSAVLLSLPGCWYSRVDWSQIPPETEGAVRVDCDEFSGEYLLRASHIPARGPGGLVVINVYTSSANLNSATISFSTFSRRPYLLDCDFASVMIDGDVQNLTDGDYSCDDVDCNELFCQTEESRTYSVPFSLVEQISMGRTVKFKVCASVVSLSPAAIQTFKDLVSQRDKIFSAIQQDYQNLQE